MRAAENAGHYVAAAINTIFALLSSVTLIGIVFITRPQQVMHDIAPHWWVPLMLVMVPTQVASQYLTWNTVYLRQIPSPLNISGNQPGIPSTLQPVVALFWTAGFFMWFAMLVTFYNPPPTPDGAVIWPLIQLALLSFAFTSMAYVYLMLFARSITQREELIDYIWRRRWIVKAMIAIVAIVCYKIIS